MILIPTSERLRPLKKRQSTEVATPPEPQQLASTQAKLVLPKALRRMTDFDFSKDTPEQLRKDLLAHFGSLGLTNLTEQVGKDGVVRPDQHALDKDGIRKAHQAQRAAYLANEAKMSGRYWPKVISRFADGDKLCPEKIKPVLVPVESGTFENELFRFATTLWSVPVSRGFGRRMRYLVMDEYHDKLIGIFALGDPVFNLRARDQLIGWGQAERRARLVDIMDGYVIGSMPPYSALLGGKLVTSLLGSKEVSDDFKAKYGQTTGIISKTEKGARLALITVTSALGKSSIYNRLHLKDPNSGDTLVRLDSIGMTDGYGHFHLSDLLFARMRYMLIQQKHPYATKHKFGDGPNWRMRTIRVALSALGLSPNLVRHGISREVFAMPLVQNYKNVLLHGKQIYGSQRPTVDDIGTAALERWVLPRAQSRPEYRRVRREDYLAEQLAFSPTLRLL